MSTKNVTMPLREFPQSIAAEAAELLCVRAFYHFENRAIYEALLRISTRGDGKSIDCVLLRDELITMGKMEDVGVEYIAKVMDSIPSSANAIYYAKIVREKYQLRKLIAACKDICDSAFEQGETVDELIDQAKASIFATDLRESGSIEQDADVVLLLLHREDYYQKGQADYCNTNVTDIIVAKQRNGATGAIKLTFLSELSRFESYAPSEQ